MGTQSETPGDSVMRSEASRLSTFHTWPHNDKVEAGKIAKAGFFHTGNESEVKCLWCGTVLNEWEYGDQVMARHRSASPQCPFIRNISDNVPLISSNDAQMNPSQQGIFINSKYLNYSILSIKRQNVLTKSFLAIILMVKLSFIY